MLDEALGRNLRSELRQVIQREIMETPFRRQPRKANSINPARDLAPAVPALKKVNLPDQIVNDTVEGKKPVKRQSNLSLRENRKTVCKERPDPVSKHSGSGLSRPFVPWCRRK